jgi:peptidoglycan/LPS O-acetylase OafA/YrhL
MVGKTLAAFWVRRCFRLLPSAWLWLVLILLAVAFFNGSGVFGTLKANLWATAVAVANVANFRFADAFMRYEYGASFVYWSLSLEEQFYLLLPLCALVFRRHLHWMLLALILVQALQLHTPLLMSIRTDALAWGVLLAMAHGSSLWQRLEPRFLDAKWLRLPTVIALFATTALLSADHVSLPLGLRIGLIAALCATAVWIASYDRDYFCRSGTIKKVMLWTGSRSYAIYLVHIPAFFLIRETAWRIGATDARGSSYSLAIYAVAATLLIGLLAEATYRLVDSPFRNVGKALARRIRSGSTRQGAIAAPNPTD